MLLQTVVMAAAVERPAPGLSTATDRIGRVTGHSTTSRSSALMPEPRPRHGPGGKKRADTQATAAEAGRPGARAAGGAGAGRRARWRTSTGRSTTSVPAVDARRRVARGAGEGPVRGPGRRRVRRRAGREQRARGPAGPAAARGQRRAGAVAGGGAALGAVAARYAGTRSDVLRLAVPPRHATVEKQPSAAAPAQHAGRGGRRSAPGRLRGRRRLPGPLGRGESPRAVWSALPGADWPWLLADAAAATLAVGPGVAAVRPRPRDVARARRGADRGARPRPSRGAHRRRRAGGALPRLPRGLPGSRARWSSAPGPRRSPRCTTSAWSRCGTTATTCTPSRARRTRTPGRCC